MEDQIKLQKLIVPCRVGCTAAERAFPQLLTITITLTLSLKKAAHYDSLKYTVDYARVAAEVELLLEKKTFSLIETVAEEISEYALNLSRIDSVMVEIEKRVIPAMDAAVVSIHRKR